MEARANFAQSRFTVKLHESLLVINAQSLP